MRTLRATIGVDVVIGVGVAVSKGVTSGVLVGITERAGDGDSCAIAEPVQTSALKTTVCTILVISSKSQPT